MDLLAYKKEDTVSMITYIQTLFYWLNYEIDKKQGKLDKEEEFEDTEEQQQDEGEVENIQCQYVRG